MYGEFINIVTGIFHHSVFEHSPRQSQSKKAQKKFLLRSSHGITEEEEEKEERRDGKTRHNGLSGSIEGSSMGQ